jgi:hypothetical protein
VPAWRDGDVRAVYYSVLTIIVLWGMAALRLAQPIVLLKLLGNMAGVVFVVAPLHLLYINTRLLPPHVRPPMWRRAVLVGMALFYGFFVILSFSSLWTGDCPQSKSRAHREVDSPYMPATESASAIPRQLALHESNPCHDRP